ncbi:unnamed protein product [Amoebophrya sp. A120]|nr:unnamed protein product [Amoebophrya sp. A120]|eukprot:GSA120T00015304001.1
MKSAPICTVKLDSPAEVIAPCSAGVNTNFVVGGRRALQFVRLTQKGPDAFGQEERIRFLADTNQSSSNESDFSLANTSSGSLGPQSWNDEVAQLSLGGSSTTDARFPVAHFGGPSGGFRSVTAEHHRGLGPLGEFRNRLHAEVRTGCLRARVQSAAALRDSSLENLTTGDTVLPSNFPASSTTSNYPYAQISGTNSAIWRLKKSTTGEKRVTGASAHARRGVLGHSTPVAYSRPNIEARECASRDVARLSHSTSSNEDLQTKAEQEIKAAVIPSNCSSEEVRQIFQKPRNRSLTEQDQPHARAFPFSVSQTDGGVAPGTPGSQPLLRKLGHDFDECDNWSVFGLNRRKTRSGGATSSLPFSWGGLQRSGQQDQPPDVQYCISIERNLQARLRLATTSVCFHPASEGFVASSSANGMLCLWDVAQSGSYSPLLTKWNAGTRQINSICFLPPSGSTMSLVSADAAGAVKLWTLPDPTQEIGYYEIETDPEGSERWGREYFKKLGERPWQRVQEITDGEARLMKRCPVKSVHSQKLSQSTTQLLTAHEDGSVLLYEGSASRFARKSAYLVSSGQAVYSVRFSPGIPHMFAAGTRDKKITVFDAREQGKKPCTQIKVGCPVSCIRWRPLANDPHVLATCSNIMDHQILVWDMRATSLPVFVFNSHRKSEFVGDFFWASPDHIVSTGKDSTIQLHSLRVGSHEPWRHFSNCKAGCAGSQEIVCVSAHVKRKGRVELHRQDEYPRMLRAFPVDLVYASDRHRWRHRWQGERGLAGSATKAVASSVASSYRNAFPAIGHREPCGFKRFSASFTLEHDPTRFLRLAVDAKGGDFWNIKHIPGLAASTALAVSPAASSLTCSGGDAGAAVSNSSMRDAPEQPQESNCDGTGTSVTPESHQIVTQEKQKEALLAAVEHWRAWSDDNGCPGQASTFAALRACVRGENARGSGSVSEGSPARVRSSEPPGSGSRRVRSKSEGLEEVADRVYEPFSDRGDLSDSLDLSRLSALSVSQRRLFLRVFVAQQCENEVAMCMIIAALTGGRPEEQAQTWAGWIATASEMLSRLRLHSLQASVLKHVPVLDVAGTSSPDARSSCFPVACTSCHTPYAPPLYEYEWSDAPTRDPALPRHLCGRASARPTTSISFVHEEHSRRGDQEPQCHAHSTHCQAPRLQLQPCGRCHAAPKAKCAVCGKKVRGQWFACPRCASGGHLEHMAEYFDQHNSCPLCKQTPGTAIRQAS